MLFLKLHIKARHQACHNIMMKVNLNHAGFVCVGSGHIDPIYQRENPWPPISLLIVVIPCSLYSDHVKPGPCRWPSKERLITGRNGLFAISFCLFSGAASLPPSLSLSPCSLLLVGSYQISFLFHIIFIFFPLSTDSSLKTPPLQVLHLHVSAQAEVWKFDTVE